MKKIIISTVKSLTTKLLQLLRESVSSQKKRKKKNRLKRTKKKKKLTPRLTLKNKKETEFYKKYLDRLAKLNEELPYLEQKAPHKGKTVKTQAMIKKTRKKVQKQGAYSRIGINKPY
ncbi:hypothetical protein A8C32_18210 [Flavivirga aquatica]|uniref:Uncharacterized protein n=1 Tax=Flavivirga aquatica TaxID=1849968 RepID=A0A1E5T7L4_9FLAO|nr:hypothetical protein [Flavivirga aquatica]OEK07371.1 hypothetical protein A8C32_18210 [Flavivirga aquatica]